jgi:hypothetical protein
MEACVKKLLTSKQERHEFAMHLFLRAYVASEDRVDFLRGFLEAVHDTIELDDPGSDSEWTKIGFDDFLAVLSGARAESDNIFAYTALVKLLADNMKSFGIDDIDVNGDGPLWLKLHEIGKVSDSLQQKYIALGQVVIDEAQAEVEMADAEEEEGDE